MCGRTSVFDYLDAIQTVPCKILLSRSPVGRCQLMYSKYAYLEYAKTARRARTLQHTQKNGDVNLNTSLTRYKI
jgi:hypothetical protein